MTPCTVSNKNVTSKWGCSYFMCMCVWWTHLTMELNQKFTKSMPRRCLLRVFTRRKNTYARNWGSKRREVVCSGYFGELMVHKDEPTWMELQTVKSHANTVVFWSMVRIPNTQVSPSKGRRTTVAFMVALLARGNTCKARLLFVSTYRVGCIPEWQFIQCLMS